MSVADMDPASAAERLDALATAFNTVVRKDNLKISDVCVRSIADPATAFEKRPHFLKRAAQWFVRSVLRKDTSFIVAGKELKVRMYDTDSNVREIRHLFRSALQTMTYPTTSQEQEKMARILQFALNADMVAKGPSFVESSQKILRDYLMGVRSGDMVVQRLEVRDVSVEKSFGEMLIDCAWPLAKEGKIELLNLAMLLSATQHVLTENERVALVRIVGVVIRQHVKAVRTLRQIVAAWEADLQILHNFGIIADRSRLTDGCSALVNAVEVLVEERDADIPRLERLYASSQELLGEADRKRFEVAIAIAKARM